MSIIKRAVFERSIEPLCGLMVSETVVLAMVMVAAVVLVGM
jgi:hypothetical protein